MLLQQRDFETAPFTDAPLNLQGVAVLRLKRSQRVNVSPAGICIYLYMFYILFVFYVLYF